MRHLSHQHHDYICVLLPESMPLDATEELAARFPQIFSLGTLGPTREQVVKIQSIEQKIEAT